MDRPEQSDGMIVNSVAYRNGKADRDLAIDAIPAQLAEEGTFVWLGLVEPSAELLGRVQRVFGLHELAVEDALSAHQRPKLEEYGNGLFVVLRTAEWVDGKSTEYGETHIFVGKNFIVTVRHGSSKSYAPVRSFCESHPERLERGPGFVLYALMDFVVDNFEPVVEHLRSRLETLEAALFKPRIQRGNLADLYGLKREVQRLRAIAVPIEEIAAALMHLHTDYVPKEKRAYFRDILDHVKRTVASLDDMRDMLNSAMQVNLASTTVTQNEVVKRLAGWGAILAIPTMVFSLYGMNFKNMPELDWRFGYPLVLLVVAAGCLALWRRLKRAGWV